MKIIDKTPFQNEQGQVDLMGRLQGTLKYGPNWYPELEAQKPVIAQLERLLEKGFVLIRNLQLPGSEVIVPLILIGTHGISVLYVTHLKGFYEARRDQWNKVDQKRSTPASVNLLNRVVRLARATQIYMERQRIPLTTSVDPVLIAADPGLNIESIRPAARVVMSDAIKQFAGSLLQNRYVLRPEQVFDIAERLLHPRDPGPLEPLPFPTPAPAYDEPGPSRARVIFDASESAAPFDPADLSFAFEEQPEEQGSNENIPASLVETSPATPLPAEAGKPKRVLGMKPYQLGCLGAIFLFECLLVLGAAYYFLNLQP
jgi:hypothetical protein